MASVQLTHLSNYVSSVDDWKNGSLCTFISMMNAAHTSVVASTVLNVKACTIRLKFLQFGCQCSKSLPRRKTHSFLCTMTVSTQLVRKVHLA